MPSHPKNKEEKIGRHPGGPLERTGAQTEVWDAIIGPSIDVNSGHQLPLVKTVLQQYHSLRIKQSILAKHIAEEVKAVLDMARIPTMALKNCV